MYFLGELISLSTAFFWAFTAVSFEYAGKKVGSLSVNIIRLLFGFVLLSVTIIIVTGQVIPSNIPSDAIMWFALSGVVGLFIGDLFLFQAFVDLGSRISLLIYSSVPVISAVLGFTIFSEVLDVIDIIGMVVTLTAISLVILLRQNSKEEFHPHVKRGIVFAFVGAIAQAIGLIFSKLGLDLMIGFTEVEKAFIGTQLRVIPAIVGFVIFITIRSQWGNVKQAFGNRKALKFIMTGSLFGPFLGVSSSLLALEYTSLGISTTIAQLNVILIIPFSIVLFKEKVKVLEIIAAVIALAGVTLLFL